MNKKEIVRDKERVLNCADVITDRIKVNGGWLYRTIASQLNVGISVRQIFVPDKE